MKQVPVVIVIGCAGLAAGYWLRGWTQTAPKSTEDTKAQLIQAAMEPAAGEGKVAYTFPDQAAMQAFVDLWQQRQQRLLRARMLEGYWNNEQTALKELNNQLVSRYTLDLAKGYVFNTDERVLIEQETPAETATPAERTATEEAAATPESGTRKVIHTFADDAAMQAFAQLWQQRQSVLGRMATLKVYWDSEQQLVTKLDETLTANYSVDVTKSYTLDSQRLVLIEPPAPQAAPQPAASALQESAAGQTGDQAAASSPQPPAQDQGGAATSPNQ